MPTDDPSDPPSKSPPAAATLDDVPPPLPSDDVEGARLRASLRARLFGEAAAPVHVGRYVLLSPLGEGTMGIVYRAFDPELSRHVALKVLRGDQLGPQRRTRIRREAKALAQLQHPNVVAVHDAGDAEVGPYLAMELVDGCDLSQWCVRHPPGSSGRARALLSIARDVGAALCAAHAVGLVHRDIKPTNILVGNDGRARLGDFGLVSTGDDGGPVHSTAPSGPAPDRGADPRVTAAGAWIGTPAYMAPEQFEGEADASSDQFAYCATFFEAFGGVRPYAGSSVVEVLAAVQEGRISRPVGGASWPVGVRQALTRGLASDPKRRHADVASLLDAITVGRRRRSLAVGVGLVGAFGSAAAAWSLRPPPPCPVDAAALDAAWGPAAQQRVQTALATLGDEGGDDAWRQVQGHLDRAAQAWHAERERACAASRDPDDEALACLQRAHRVFDDGVRALSTVGEAETMRAAAASLAIADLTDCSPRARQAGAGWQSRPTATEPVTTALASGRVAERLGRGAIAADHYQRALDALGDAASPRLRTQAHLGLSRAAYWLGDEATADVQGAAALDEAQRAADPSDLVSAWLNLASDADTRPFGRFCLERARARVEAGEVAPVLRGRVHIAWGQHHAAGGDDAQAIASFTAALGELGELPGAALARTDARESLGESLLAAGRLDEAEAALSAAVHDRAALLGEGHPRVAVTRARLAQVQVFALRYPEALANYDHAVAVLQRNPRFSPMAQAGVLGLRGMARFAADDPAGGVADARAALQLTQDTLGADDPRLLGRFISLSRALLNAGEPGEALRQLQTARDAFVSVSDQVQWAKDFAQLALQRAEALVALHRDAEAMDALAQARTRLDRAYTRGSALWVDVHVRCAAVATDAGSPAEAIAIVEGVRAQLDGADVPAVSRAKLWRERARAAARQGDTAGASTAIAQTRTTLQEGGLPPDALGDLDALSLAGP